MIGSSGLEYGDLSMGMVHGEFVPSSEYDDVKSIFLLFTDEKHDEYYKKRDDLNLTLQDESGKNIPTEWIHIEDYLSENDEIRVEICLLNPELWSNSEVV